MPLWDNVRANHERQSHGRDSGKARVCSDQGQGPGQGGSERGGKEGGQHQCITDCPNLIMHFKNGAVPNVPLLLKGSSHGVAYFGARCW